MQIRTKENSAVENEFRAKPCSIQRNRNLYPTNKQNVSLDSEIIEFSQNTITFEMKTRRNEKHEKIRYYTTENYKEHVNTINSTFLADILSSQQKEIYRKKKKDERIARKFCRKQNFHDRFDLHS